MIDGVMEVLGVSRAGAGAVRLIQITNGVRIIVVSDSITRGIDVSIPEARTLRSQLSRLIRRAGE